MKTVNSISGGKTSAYIAVHFPADYEVFSLVCIDDPACAPKDAGLIKYVNDKLGEKYTQRYGEFIATAEDDQTLVALRDLEQLLGREIIWVRGASFDDVIDKPLVRLERPTRLPSWARRYCTDQMKIYPMFEWWFTTLGDKINMRIGFRFDEFDRMESFLNKNQGYQIPVAQSTRGQRLQRHEIFDWRYCSFPLVKNIIRQLDVNQYWKGKYIGGNLFEERRLIDFPEISNCVGCFHKKVETLSIMANEQTPKMSWFARQEDKGMGTWLDSRVRYDTIIANRENWIPEMLTESGAACGSGGCHD